MTISKTTFRLILNIFTALYLIFAMPQNILFEGTDNLLKIISVIIVNTCAIGMLVYSITRFFPTKKQS